MADENSVQAYGEIVKINVGGTIFETYLSTLTRIDDTVLSTMVASRWRNQEVLFVDRNPLHFAKILDYLRDIENFTPPSDDGEREELRKEAEFYNLPGLVEMCSPEVFRVGYSVQWKQSSVESYCKFLVTYWLPKNHCVVCPVCDDFPAQSGYADNNCGFTCFARFVELLHVRQHMLSARGTILSLNGTFCEVQWRKLVTHPPQEMMVAHLPQSALRLAKN
ncbi:unnamed protein product [Cylicocyclus nassatus]|uniref:BTB domain-containing protein n=1 Tax=Cylicocyclus nassatus TaxID=53992 RepID=A0AA36DR04_CYLNA|nr:unnamed protein product [Cylicocyclus nassatus]